MINRMLTNKRTVLAGCACLALVASGSAFALRSQRSDNRNPFQNISAVGSVASVVDPTTAATIQRMMKRSGPTSPVRQQLIADARALPTTLDGHRLYLIPTSGALLCMLVQGVGAEACFTPLSSGAPARFFAIDPGGPGGDQSTVYGIAADGVKSIAFTVDGRIERVPVTGNAFVLNGGPGTTPEQLLTAAATLSTGQSVNLPR